MEMLLIALTILSLGLAVTMSVVAWRATQGEKQRAAARVAALAAAAEVPVPAHVNAPASDRPDTPWRRARTTDDELSAFASEASPAPAPAVVTPAAVSVQSGFLGAESPIRESQQHQRWLRMAAAVVAVVVGGAVFVHMSRRTAEPGAAHAEAAPVPLELLSLRHERQGVNLSVSGLVRNPANGAVVERVTAVVYLFDQQGTFVTSAKAPIDFLKLTAGDESPFVVKVAAPSSVARYRVSFRTDEGTLAHLDRRGEPPVGAPVALTRSEK